MSPGSRYALLALLAILAVSGAAVVGTAGAADPAPDYAQQETPVAENTTTVIKVSLQGDSDARWTITEHFNVSSPTDRAAFEDLTQRFKNGQAEQLGLQAFRNARERVTPTVEREMQIHEVRRETSVEDGTLELSFTWTNFAREDNETRIVDDAFRTADGGTWLNGIGHGESLVIELPRGSALDTPKAVTDGTIRWNGPAEFEPGELQISYTADPAPTIPQWLWGLGVGLLVFAVVGVVGGYLMTRRDRGLSLPGDPFGRSPNGTTDEATATTTADPATSPDIEDEAESSEDDGVDLDLLSDEERVEYLIEQNGGRMKQANIVKETGWSNAKVSQLLSSMEEEGRIAKLRIGRENLISFPDEDIGEFEDT